MARRARAIKRDRFGRFAGSGRVRLAARQKARMRGPFKTVRLLVARSRQQMAAARRHNAAQELHRQRSHDRAAWGIYRNEAAFDRAADLVASGGGSPAFRRAHEAQLERFRRA